MPPKVAHIEVEGLNELQVAVKRQCGQLPKALGEAHKNVGRFVIGKLPEGDPHAVGAGSGAAVRPSATKRDVLLRVGHGGRKAHKEQWGSVPVQPFQPIRPYIVGAIQDYEAEIEQTFLDEVTKALGPAFFSAE